jgi:hypothetical protein
MKYELIPTETKTIDGLALTRIRRLSDGKKGGYIESEHNLSQDGDCWLHDESVAYGDAQITENAQVFGMVSGAARVSGSAQVYGTVTDNAVVTDQARVYGQVRGNYVASGNETIYGNRG